jgi:streptomycin 6-kinase
VRNLIFVLEGGRQGTGCGSVMLEIRVTGILKAIERWASESDERMRFVLLLVWAGFGMAVLISTLIAAWIMLPPEYGLF